MPWGGVPAAPAVGVYGDREDSRTVPRAPVSHDFPARTVCISEKCRREQSLGGEPLPLQSEPWWEPAGRGGLAGPLRCHCQGQWESPGILAQDVRGIRAFPEARARESREASSPPYSACNHSPKRRQLHVAKRQNVNAGLGKELC